MRTLHLGQDPLAATTTTILHAPHQRLYDTISGPPEPAIQGKEREAGGWHSHPQHNNTSEGEMAKSMPAQHKMAPSLPRAGTTRRRGRDHRGEVREEKARTEPRSASGRVKPATKIVVVVVVGNR